MNGNLGHDICHVVRCLLLQEKAVSRVSELFEKADLNNDGKLTMEELRIMMKDASKEYPHLEEHSRFLEG